MEDFDVLKFKKLIAIIAISIIGLVSLTGCYNFYNDWHGAGADIESTNVFKAITLDEAKKKIENKDTFVVVCATSSNSSAVKVIENFCNTATYFNFTGTTYFINKTEYLSLTSKRNELKAGLNINGRDSTLSSETDVIVVCYTQGKVTIDTTAKLTDSSLRAFVNDVSNPTSINYNSLISYIYKDFEY